MATEEFHLPAPFGFRGLSPDLPLRVYQRHLPHWRQDGATYFVTFRLADSIPQTQLQALKRWRRRWEQAHPEPRDPETWLELARQVSTKTEAWLDEGYGSCVLREPTCARLLGDSLLHFQEVRYTTFCSVIMPNHVHVAVKPHAGFELTDILRDTKGYVSRQINRHLGRSGPLWEEESYDRIIRDEEHLFRVVQYIGNNPAKAGLPEKEWYRWVHPHWIEAGWGFRDAVRPMPARNPTRR